MRANAALIAALACSSSLAGPADDYVANEAKKNAWFLGLMQKMKLPCDRVVREINEPRVFRVIVCEMKNGTRIIYEQPYLAVNGQSRTRVATVEQVQDDEHTVAMGLGLAGDWWK